MMSFRARHIALACVLVAGCSTGPGPAGQTPGNFGSSSAALSPVTPVDCTGANNGYPSPTGVICSWDPTQAAGTTGDQRPYIFPSLFQVVGPDTTATANFGLLQGNEFSTTFTVPIFGAPGRIGLILRRLSTTTDSSNHSLLVDIVSTDKSPTNGNLEPLRDATAVKYQQFARGRFDLSTLSFNATTPVDTHAEIALVTDNVTQLGPNTTYGIYLHIEGKDHIGVAGEEETNGQDFYPNGTPFTRQMRVTGTQQVTLPNGQVVTQPIYSDPDWVPLANRDLNFYLTLGNGCYHHEVADPSDPTGMTTVTVYNQVPVGNGICAREVASCDANGNINPYIADSCKVDADCQPYTSQEAAAAEAAGKTVLAPWIISDSTVVNQLITQYGSWQAFKNTFTCNTATGICNKHAEVCDAIDDDCNGTVDDNNEVAQTAPCGFGPCRRTVPNCDGAGHSVTCTPDTSKATTETCNGIDDDCNGIVDDGFGYSSCGNGLCEDHFYNCLLVNGTWTNVSADNGKAQAVCPEALPGNATTTNEQDNNSGKFCNGLDDDCDGYVDNVKGTQNKVWEYYWPGALSKRNVGICKDGVQTCNAAAAPDPYGPGGNGTWQAQTAVWSTSGSNTVQPVLPTTETCNGLDDDCDGNTDNPVAGNAAHFAQSFYDKTGALGAGTGQVGVGICHAGTQTCDEGTLPSPNTPGSYAVGTKAGLGQWGVTTAEQGPVAETCNGVDDDCNGLTDDGLGSTTCGKGVCTVTIQNCVGGQDLSHTCTPNSAKAGLETCNNLDDDCDGYTDNAPGSTSNNTLSGACFTALTSYNSSNGGVAKRNTGVCHDGSAICSSGTWGTCVGEAGPSNEVCNGLDDNCDGTIDNGGAALCALTSHAATTSCGGAAGCSITSCATYYYDFDGAYANGCEFSDDMYAISSGNTGTTCQSGYSIGAFTAGTSKSITGVIPDPSLHDFYNFTDSSQAAGVGQKQAGNVTVSISPNNEFKFKIYSASCAGQYGAAAGSCANGSLLDTFQFNDTVDDVYGGAANTYGTRSYAFPSTVYVDVQRVAGVGSLKDTYTLTVTR